jgi:hypothetical protein
MEQQQLPPDAIFMQLIFGKMIACSISGLARTGAADHMGPDPRPVSDIAADAGVNVDALARVLRMLSGVGVAIESPGPSFGLTPVGMLLRANSPGSLRNMAMMMADRWTMGAYAHMEHCIRTGGNGVEKAFGTGPWGYMNQHPDERDTFAAAMGDFTAVMAPAVATVGDFSRFRRIADVGGSHGVLLANLLAANDGLQGVLFDLPEVVAGAPDAGHLAAFGDRVSFESGSFFERVPADCDAYIMKHIVHDWDDASAVRILSLMRDALAAHAPESGRVLLAEMVVPEEPGPAPAKFLDIEMLVLTDGGRERTEGEFAALFARAGLELVGIARTPGPMCVVEARVA